MRALALLTVVMASACVTPISRLVKHQTLDASAGKIELHWSAIDEGEHEKVAHAVNASLPVLKRWGVIERSVQLYILQSHDDLERAIRHNNYSWLRAWARDEAVYLQSPRTWKANGASEAEITETLTHELTHVLLFQQCGPTEAWVDRQIPFWFREGMATVTASQGYRYAGLEDTARWVETHRDLDVFTDGDSLTQHYSDQAYGVAHHAMMFLIRRYSDAGVISLMKSLRDGAAFPDAFKISIGVTSAEFAHEFRNYLTFRGFRGYGLPFRKAPQQPTPDASESPRKIAPPEAAPPRERLQE